MITRGGREGAKGGLEVAGGGRQRRRKEEERGGWVWWFSFWLFDGVKETVRERRKRGCPAVLVGRRREEMQIWGVFWWLAEGGGSWGGGRFLASRVSENSF